MKTVPIKDFVDFLRTQLREKAGYIMGSRGQNPRTGYMDLSVKTVRSSWKPTGWYYTQYSGKQREKALYWREKAKRVFDCNGLAEGCYELATGININSKARFNYADWCSVKGSGMIPAKYRVPGAAVFWSDSGAGSIHHVGYLVEPVGGAKDGDWYIIEARGVMYGVVKTRLLTRRPNFWGLMTKYYDYGEQAGAETAKADARALGSRTLKNGCCGDDVRELQAGLIRLAYDLGRWGADGDYGDCTEEAVRQFQRAKGLKVDGVAGEKTIAALQEALAGVELPVPEKQDGNPQPAKVQISGGQCYCRAKPNTAGAIYGVAHECALLDYAGEISDNGWLKVVWTDGREGWVSGKYGRLVA